MVEPTDPSPHAVQIEDLRITVQRGSVLVRLLALVDDQGRPHPGFFAVVDPDVARERARALMDAADEADRLRGKPVPAPESIMRT